VISRRQRARKRGRDNIAESKEESCKREREEGRMCEESTNPFRKSSRRGRSPSRNEKGNKSKEIDNEMKTIISEIREDTAGIREENKILKKELEENGELRKELAVVR
jgi:uncharacterized protein YaaN involved in tellurite resistance